MKPSTKHPAYKHRLSKSYVNALGEISDSTEVSIHLWLALLSLSVLLGAIGLFLENA